MTNNNNAVVTAPPTNNNVVVNTTNNAVSMYAPRNYSELLDLAAKLAQTSFVPPQMQGKPTEIFVAMQLGSEIGLPLLQSVQSIAVINGRPCVWGDAMIALVRSSPLCEYINEEFKDGVAICTVKRKGNPEYTSTFSEAQAKVAGLWGKVGPWKLYPERMLKMRARGFALRDVFPDVLRGLQSAEEQQDTLYHKQQQRQQSYNNAPQVQPEKDITAQTKKDISEQEFVGCLIKMRAAIENGSRTAQQCLENVRKNYLVTDEQADAILALEGLRPGGKPHTVAEWQEWIKLGTLPEFISGEGDN